SGANGAVSEIVVQPDNRILMGGDFTLVNGSFRQRIGRLMSDGSTDVSFTATVNGPVNAIAVQSNGRIVIGGAFTTVGGLPRASIARLNANGSVDPTFDPGIGANGAVNAVAVLSDGKVVLGGSFTGIGGIVLNRIARLNDDGTVDATFDPGIGAYVSVNASAVPGNGRIVIGC